MEAKLTASRSSNPGGGSATSPAANTAATPKPTSLQRAALLECLYALEHRRGRQHVGQNEESHLAAADKHVLQVTHFAVPPRMRHAPDLHVHVVLHGHQCAAVHVARPHLHRHYVRARLVQQLDRNSNRHPSLYLISARILCHLCSSRFQQKLFLMSYDPRYLINKKKR